MAIAALVATFWLLVATVRLVVHAPASVAPPPACPALLARIELERKLKAAAAQPFGPCANPAGCLTTKALEELATGPVSRSALIDGLNAVKPRIHACYQAHRVPGTAMVNIAIAKSGRVSSAQVTGKFAGTPTGACVEAAVKNAWFPPSDRFRTPYLFELK